MLYSQSYIEKFKFSTVMFKTVLLSATSSSSALIMKQYFSDWVDPVVITTTAVLSAVLIVFKLKNEIHKYNTRNDRKNESK